MAPGQPASSRHATGADSSAAVDAFMAAQPPALAAQLQQLRQAILAVDPSINEGIKWNAPSFRTHEYFATFNLRGRQGPMLILHWVRKHATCRRAHCRSTIPTDC